MPDWSPPSIELVAWLACIVAAFFAVLWWRATHRGRRRTRRRQRRSRAGEDAAGRLLEAAGFRVLDEQPFVNWEMQVDGQHASVRSRADLLVEAWRTRLAPRGMVFVAEVKTGSTAPDPTHPATRRQLLEYLHAFDVDGILLVDMEAGRVRVVMFPEGW